MVLILVKYVCKNGCREAFLDEIRRQGIDSGSRNEAGNICYEYAFDAENENILVLTEIWKDQEAVAQHGEMLHFKALGELKSAFVERTEIQRFSAEKL